MEMKKFVTTLKECKSINKYTAFFGVKVKTNTEHTRQTIYKSDVCKTCNHEGVRNLFVEFFEPVHLTIFQAEMLWAVYMLKRKPRDYASYHKCIAGQKFINRIKNIRTE